MTLVSNAQALVPRDIDIDSTLLFLITAADSSVYRFIVGPVSRSLKARQRINPYHIIQASDDDARLGRPTQNSLEEIK